MSLIKSSYIYAYVDGSYYSKANFAGSAVYFGDIKYDIEQYMPDDMRWGAKTAMRAEMYAALLAARQGINMGLSEIIIRQDCKGAIKLLTEISTYSAKKVESMGRIFYDPLLHSWWKVIQYIHFTFEWVPAHTSMSKEAKRAANRSRYIQDIIDMDRQNPFNIAPNACTHTRYDIGLPRIIKKPNFYN
jgi:ribonuclease HI